MTGTVTDQAEKLRNLMSQANRKQTGAEGSEGTVIAVTSGKGGVGKSNFCINFALGLKELGHKPVIIDADVGFADVEVLLGVHPEHSFVDVMQGMSIWDALAYDQTGLPFLAASTGLTDIHDVGIEDMQRLMQEMEKLHEKFDIVLIDSGAGMGRNIGQLLTAADEIILVTTPEPTAIADAYAVMKMLSLRGSIPPTRMVVNRVHNFVSGKEAAEKLQLVASRFLDVEVGILGYILEDSTVSKAVMEQSALMSRFPDSVAGRCFQQLVRNYLRLEPPKERRGIGRFFERLFGRSRTTGQVVNGQTMSHDVGNTHSA